MNHLTRQLGRRGSDMQDFWLNLAITTIIGVLQGAVKNAATKKKIRSAMIKIRDMITVLYPKEEFTAESARKAKKTLKAA